MEINKKIGILTFHTADNYGAVLQAYALQTTIENFGYKSVEIIDFNTDIHQKEYSIFKKLSNNFLKNIILNGITLLLYNQLRTKKERFSKFRRDYLHLTSHRYIDEDEIKQKLCIKDIYISGSDQVFNPYNRYKETYYLGFDKKNNKKVAYAPSFGVSEFPDDVMFPLIPYIKDFDYLSCREKEGAKYLSKVIGYEVPVVLDPVFLLSKDEWLKIAITPKVTSKYIFVYDLNGGMNLIEIAKRLKQKYNMPIICATGNIRKNYHIDKQLYDVGPLELIGYINNAEYVVTDSFHGSAFSIILKSKLFSYIATEKTSSRIKTILNNLNMSDQIVTDKDCILSKEEPKMNYSDILEKYIQLSKNWLCMSLSK